MQHREVRPSGVKSLSILRLSIGVIYFWFGALKFFHGYSPAEALATKTIHVLSFGLMSDRMEMTLLAVWECLIGILLITRQWIRPTLVLLFIHMFCTFSPFILFPADTFFHMPYGLSLTGQYIVKNIVIISAALVLWQNEKEKGAQHITRAGFGEKRHNGKATGTYIRIRGTARKAVRS